MSGNAFLSRTLPSVGILTLVTVVLMWDVITTGGLIRGHDMAVNTYAAYEARAGSWQSIWDDVRFPGTTKPAPRLTLVQYALVGMTNVFGDVTVSMRVLEVLLIFLALLFMYMLVRHLTKSHAAGVIAAVVFVINRGAPFQGQLAFTAGYALAPLVFLTLDRLLNSRRPWDIVPFAIAYSVFFTSAILPFAYIVTLFLGLYTIVYFVARLLKEPLDQAAGVIASRTVSLIASVVLFVLLSSYYLAGLLVSTAAVVIEQGGYSLEDVASRAVGFRDAVELRGSGGFLFDTSAMGTTNLLIAIVAFTTIVYRRSYWTTAFVLMSAIGIVLASQVESGFYELLYTNVPLFSLVRIARRWEAMTLLGYAVLVGTAVQVAINLVAQRQWSLPSLRLPSGLSRRVPGMGNSFPRVFDLPTPVKIIPIAGLVALVIVTAFVQWQGQKEWFQTYVLPDNYVDPYRWLTDKQDNVVVATVPFLNTRIFDERALVTGDFGRLLAPAVGNKPLITGFRFGGFQVNEGLRTLINEIETPVLLVKDPVTLRDDEYEVVDRRWDNLLLETRLRMSDSQSGRGVVGIQFRRVSSGQSYVAVFDEEAGEVRLERRGRRPLVLDSAPFQIQRGREYQVMIGVEDAQMRVYVDGRRVLIAVDSGFEKGGITLESKRATTEFTDLRITRLPRVFHPNRGGMKKLSLMNTRYVVVQPYTNPVEKNRFLSLDGFNVVYDDDGAVIGENTYAFPRIFAANTLALAVGINSEAAVDSLVRVDGFELDQILVLDHADFSAPDSEGILADADYLILDNAVDPASTPQQVVDYIAASPSDELPALVHILPLGSTSSTLGETPVLQNRLVELSDESQEIVGRKWKSFVLETRVLIEPSTADEPYAGIVFKVRNDKNRYELRMSASTGSVELVVVQDARVASLAASQMNIQSNQWYDVRLAVDDTRFTVFVDDKLTLEAEDESHKRGPIAFVARHADARFDDLKVTNPGEDAGEFLFLKTNGFGTSAYGVDEASAGESTVLPHQFTSVSKVRVLKAGDYRLSFKIGDSDLVSASATIRPAGSQQGANGPLNLNAAEPIVYDNKVTGEPETYTWVTSRAAFLAPGEYMVEILVKGEQPIIDTVLLYNAPVGVSDRSAPGDLFDRGGNRPQVNFEKISSSRYSINVNSDGPSFLVFKDTYHKDWNASINGELLPHYHAYGDLNAYKLPDTAGAPASVDLTFRLQSTFDRGKLISVATVVLLILAIGGIAAHAAYRKYMPLR